MHATHLLPLLALRVRLLLLAAVLLLRVVGRGLLLAAAVPLPLALPRLLLLLLRLLPRRLGLPLLLLVLLLLLLRLLLQKVFFEFLSSSRGGEAAREGAGGEGETGSKARLPAPPAATPAATAVLLGWREADAQASRRALQAWEHLPALEWWRPPSGWSPPPPPLPPLPAHRHQLQELLEQRRQQLGVAPREPSHLQILENVQELGAEGLLGPLQGGRLGQHAPAHGGGGGDAGVKAPAGAMQQLEGV